LAKEFSSGLMDSVIAKCTEKNSDQGEAIRDVDDALSCVTDLEFLGAKSKKFLKENDPKSNTFCTLPVKVEFEDRNSRINFEKTLKEHTGLRASMSIPALIRDEMKSFCKTLSERYLGEIVVVRLDTRSAELHAVRKVDKAEGWNTCGERFSLPHGIMLPGFVTGSSGKFPPVVNKTPNSDQS
jgi:hypothetical protein